MQAEEGCWRIVAGDCSGGKQIEKQIEGRGRLRPRQLQPGESAGEVITMTATVEEQVDVVPLHTINIAYGCCIQTQRTDVFESDTVLESDPVEGSVLECRHCFGGKLIWRNGAWVGVRD